MKIETTKSNRETEEINNKVLEKKNINHEQ